MRIHYTTLAKGTARKLTKQARQGDTWQLNSHAVRMLRQRNIQIDDVKETIRTGSLVEYNTDFGTRHILLRGESGVCVVVDLDLKEVATVYANRPEDNHKTLNLSRYLLG
jgi:hypothetical protein